MLIMDEEKTEVNMSVDDVQIPNILWILFAILMGLMALTVGKETSESRKQIELEKALVYDEYSQEYEQYH